MGKNDEKQCPKCMGTGEVVDVIANVAEDCPICDGKGTVDRETYEANKRAYGFFYYGNPWEDDERASSLIEDEDDFII